MPQDKRKRFYIKLLLNKKQHILFDHICDRLNRALKSAIERSFVLKENGIAVSPWLCANHIETNILLYGLEEFTEFEIKSLVNRTMTEYERLEKEGIDLSNYKGRPLSFLYEIPTDQVIFSTEYDRVRLPEFGLIKIVKNKFAIINNEDTGGLNVILHDGRFFLGYKNNDPVLLLDSTKEDKPEIEEQKLVRIDTNE